METNKDTKKLGNVGDFIFTTPDPYKDLGEMPQKEVNQFVKDCLQII